MTLNAPPNANDSGTSELHRARLVRHFVHGLSERGKIKIGSLATGDPKGYGGNGDAGKPQMLDHFRVTTLERGADGNYLPDEEVQSLHGEKPRTLPVRMLFDEIGLNFQCRRACYIKRRLWCSGDGETARRLTRRDGRREIVNCPCARSDPGYAGPNPCRPRGCLSVVIDGVNRVGGVWKFRTSSYHSTASILASLALIRRVTGGPLAGIPLMLTLEAKTVHPVTRPEPVTIQVAALHFEGSFEELEAIGRREAERRTRHLLAIDRIEAQTRALFADDPADRDDRDDEDTDGGSEPGRNAEPEKAAHRSAGAGSADNGERDSPAFSAGPRNGTRRETAEAAGTAS